MVLAVAGHAQFINYGYAGLPTVVSYAAPAPVPAAVYAVPSYTASQYHAQDELGQASFGYAHPGQAASNIRDAYGNQIGSYAYINPEGKEIRVSYTADHRGFRVLSNALPEGPVAGPVADLAAPLPVQDTPEVAEAKAAHLAAIEAAKSGVVPAAPVDLPVPVQDTPEVAQAKAEHEAAKVAAAKAAAEATPAVRRKRQILTYASAPVAVALNPLGYSAVAAVPANPVREATLTRTVLTPGHAVAYRVD